MASNREAARRFAAQIGENLRKKMDEDLEPKLRAQATQIVALIMSEMEGFHDVTGNTKNSIVVGLYYEKRLKYIATSADILSKPAARATLKTGEAYNLPNYWDGTPVSRVGKYVGETGDSNYMAAAEGLRLIRAKQPGLSNKWAYIILTSVKYASYLEKHKNANVITNSWEDLKASGAEVGPIRVGG